MCRINLRLSAFSLLFLAGLTGCQRVILVRHNYVGPMWSSAHQLVWQGRADRFSFIVYVPDGLCKEPVDKGSPGPPPLGGDVQTYALKPANRVTCTLMHARGDQDIVYYLGFLLVIGPDRSHLPPAPPAPPADTEGPFAIRVGKCNNC